MTRTIATCVAAAALSACSASSSVAPEQNVPAPRDAFFESVEMEGERALVMRGQGVVVTARSSAPTDLAEARDAFARLTSQDFPCDVAAATRADPLGWLIVDLFFARDGSVDRFLVPHVLLCERKDGAERCARGLGPALEQCVLTGLTHAKRAASDVRSMLTLSWKATATR